MFDDYYLDNCDQETPPNPLTPQYEEFLKEVERLKNKPRVYISSPYTKGDVAVNVKVQMDAADDLMELGIAPFTPLYSHFQHMAHPRPYDEWLEIDKVWVLMCHALYRIPSEIPSSGADIEEKLAKDAGIPVFYDIDEMVEYFKNKGQL